ncbi:MAG: ThuA domain-containing protein [Verrucomicrobiota bacterium]
MKVRFLSGLIFAFILSVFPASEGFAAPRLKQILFFSKSSGYEHAVIKRTDGQPSLVEKTLQEIGEKNHFEFTFTKDGSVFTKENLKKYDAFFFYTTGDLTEAGNDKNPPMTAEGKAAFLEAIQKGRGFIGTHSATDTFHSPGNKDHGAARFKSDSDNADAYVKMIGAEFIVHGSQQPSHMIVADKKFPGMKTVPDNFAPVEEWYSLKDFASNLHVLLVQETAGMTNSMYQRSPYPATWARKYGKGRVFYTSMGHREDMWANPVFQEVLTGGINWAVGNVKTDVTPNIDKITPGANQLPPPK